MEPILLQEGVVLPTIQDSPEAMAQRYQQVVVLCMVAGEGAVTNMDVVEVVFPLVAREISMVAEEGAVMV
jgi:hypothetical protein